jgi:hypothetical protein
MAEVARFQNPKSTLKDAYAARRECSDAVILVDYT